MINSLRGRLTLYYLAAFALLLVILATSTYFFLQHEIAHRTDDDLSQLADSFVTTVRKLSPSTRLETVFIWSQILTAP
jgi:type VI protein secretion system component VasK